MSEHTRIVEINGVKIEIDLRTAKQVSEYKIGDRIKVLVKQYSDGYRVYPGLITGFDDFKGLPTISIAYIEDGYQAGVKFAAINSKSSEDLQISPCGDDDEIGLRRNTVIDALNRKIETKEAELQSLIREKEYFVNRFAKWFANV